MRPVETKWSYVLAAIMHRLAHMCASWHAITSHYFLAFCPLLVQSPPISSLLFVENRPIFLSHSLPPCKAQISIAMQRSRGRKQGPEGLVDQCHMTRETHKVSLGSQKHRCPVVGLHKGREGQNHGAFKNKRMHSFELMNICKMTWSLVHI